tara:strand:+ start:1864 stop:2013 length:150 start_codon:yes stop_codon:yes gene_type:complete
MAKARTHKKVKGVKQVIRPARKKVVCGTLKERDEQLTETVDKLPKLLYI